MSATAHPSVDVRIHFLIKRLQTFHALTSELKSDVYCLTPDLAEVKNEQDVVATHNFGVPKYRGRLLFRKRPTVYVENLCG